MPEVTLVSPNLRCRDYYQTHFAGYARYLGCGVALDECPNDFLDQRPSGKYTQRHRASGLAGADFRWQPAVVTASNRYSTFAVGRDHTM